MSTLKHRDTPPGEGGSVELRLARLLDAPFLARVVPHLPAETLHQLIRHKGLEAAGELVTSATPAQLTSVLDLDLWRNAQPGRVEQFDVARFGEWLEALVDTGESVAARIIATLDRDLVIEGLSRYVRVFDPGIFEPVAQSDDEAIDRHDAMREGDHHASRRNPHDDGVECEVGGYLVRALRTEAWDAIVALLVVLESEQSDCFRAVMKGCRLLSNSRPETDGLDHLLPIPDQHLYEVASDRERRRSQQGYATVADARAFLKMARQATHTHREATTAPGPLNPLVAAYFRAAEEEAPSPAAAQLTSGQGGATEDAEPIQAVIELLAEAGMMPDRPRALLESGDAGETPAALARLRHLLEYVRDIDDGAYVSRTRELAFLGNTLLAGCSIQSRPFTAPEAADAAASVCNLGLEQWDSTLPDRFLVDHDLVTVFEVGWSTLYREVSLFVADQLIKTLDSLRGIDLDTRREVAAFQRALVKHREAGTPWLARSAADALAMLDMTAWISVLGLLDECAIRPASLTAILERRTTSVNPNAFEFISTPVQIGDIRVFMGMLPRVLSR